MTSKKQIEQDIHNYIAHTLTKKTGGNPQRKMLALVYVVGYLQSVLAESLYENPTYIQQNLLARLKKDKD
jgi:hypothetical protein